MENQRPSQKEFDAYQKVNAYINSKINKNLDNHISLFPKPKWLWLIVLAVISCVFYYGLTTLIFGEDFYVMSITGKQ